MQCFHRTSGAVAVLLAGWFLGSTASQGAVLFLVGQASELGQELQRLRQEVQQPPPVPPERKKPPKALVDKEDGREAVELTEEPQQIKERIAERIDEDSAQLERDAEAILKEAEEAVPGEGDAAGAMEAAPAEAPEAEVETEPMETEAREEALPEPAAPEAAEAMEERPEVQAEAEPEVSQPREEALEEPGAEAMDEPPEAEIEATEEVAAQEAEVVEAEEEEAPDVEEDAPAEEEPRRRVRRPRRRAGGAEFEIATVTLEGDAHLMDELGLTRQLREEVVGQTLSTREIRNVARAYNKALVDAGYYLSRITTPPAAIRKLREGELVLEIDEGRVGRTRFYSPADGEEKVPYRGRWYSEKQLRQRLSGLEEGEPFRYDDFYKSVFTVNSHPDLTMDTDLKVRRERTEEGRIQRYVDMDFTVQDRIPLHGVFEIQNSGTEATEKWRMALTLQHLNLTKRDDVLTLTLPVSIDLSTIRSVAGSYYLPHRIGKGGAFTIYGGYSELDTEDLVPNIDLTGEGYFGGFLGSYDLISTDYHSLKLSAGWAYQVIEDTLVLGGGVSAPREVTIAPLSGIASYSSVRPDRFGGRNFATAQFSLNRGGVAGASEDDEVSLLRETAEADYWITRIQFARIQPIGFGPSDPEQDASQWIFFLKLDGQLASGALIPAEQKAVGGLDNVRGYTEREILGDQGVSGTLEVRSPIWTRAWTDRLRGRENGGGGTDRLQLVAFIDGAYMTLEDALPTVDDTTTLLSVGAGLRAAITKYTQLKFDWGFPLEETELSDSGGRGHVSFEIQI